MLMVHVLVRGLLAVLVQDADTFQLFCLLSSLCVDQVHVLLCCLMSHFRITPG